MHVTFLPTITVSLSADEWDLLGNENQPARDRAAVRLSEAAGEALTLAWSALSGDTRVAQALGFPAAALEAIELGMTVPQAISLAHQHWNAVADGIDGMGASDTEPRSAFASLVQRYLQDSPATALQHQNARPTTPPAASPSPARPRR